MGIGSVLELPIQTGDQGDLVVNVLQRSKSGRESDGMDARWRHISFESPDVVLTGELWDGSIVFTWKKTSSNDSIGEVEKCESLCGFGVIRRF